MRHSYSPPPLATLPAHLISSHWIFLGSNLPAAAASPTFIATKCDSDGHSESGQRKHREKRSEKFFNLSMDKEREKDFE